MLRKSLTCTLTGLLCCLVFTVPAFAASNVRLGVTTGDNINLRATASTDGEIITTVPSDTKLVIDGSSNNFFKVNYDGKSGYLVDAFVVVYDYEKGRINASNVILRSAASTDSDRIATLDDGNKVDVYGETDGFYRVAFEENVGYVSSKYVSLSSDSDEKPQKDKDSKDTKSSKDAKESSKEEEPKKEKKSRSVDPGSYSEEELSLIAKVVHLESGGMGSEANEAVASVIYNRIISNKFPDSVEGVVFQAGQFSVVNPRDKFLNTNPSSTVEKAVRKVFVNGEVSLPADIMYFKSDRLSKSWGARKYYDKIGGNMFYS